MIPKYFITATRQPHIEYVRDGQQWTLPNGAIEYANAAALQAAIDQLSPPEDWDGFRQWRRQNPDYLALMAGPHGNLVGFLEADISRGDYASAAVLWDSLIQQGAISQELETALTDAIATYNLTSLAQALAAHNSP